MTPRKQSTSPWLSYLLMGGILSFGGGAAYMVLSDSPAKPSPAHQAPPALAATPAAVRATVTPPSRPAVQASTVPAPVVVARAPVAESVAAPVAAPVASISPAQVHTPPKAPASAPVAVPVAPAPAKVAAPAVAVPAAAVSAPKTQVPVRVEKQESTVPTAEVLDALRVAVPASTTRVSPAVAQPTTVVARSAPAPAGKVVAPVAKPSVAPAPAPAKTVKPKRVEPVKPEPKAPVKPKAAPVVKEAPVTAPRAIPVPQEISLPMMKGLPRLDVPAAVERPAPAAEAIVESRPDPKPAAKPAAEGSKPVVKSMQAAPLVPSANKPTLVMANGDKAWVKLDEQRTVIITKGQDVPGLGTFHGADKNGAKFDSGTLPVNQ